jgi:hypothetical protein
MRRIADPFFDYDQRATGGAVGLDDTITIDDTIPHIGLSRSPDDEGSIQDGRCHVRRSNRHHRGHFVTGQGVVPTAQRRCRRRDRTSQLSHPTGPFRRAGSEPATS